MVDGLHIEEQGRGDPILCVHGTGGSALGWRTAAAELARHGHVLAYDRRGCGRSDRPHPYERTSVTEHADDAASLLDALDAGAAVVIGRSYGASVALELAVRHPDRVRALVLLEGDAPPELAPGTARWVAGLGAHLRDVAAREGTGAVGAALIESVGGTWETLAADARGVLSGNGPAILAELAGRWWPADAAAIAAVRQPALLVAAAGSPPALREPTEALAAVLPCARTVTVPGGHLIDPAGPEVLAFVREVLLAPAPDRAVRAGE